MPEIADFKFIIVHKVLCVAAFTHTLFMKPVRKHFPSLYADPDNSRKNTFLQNKFL